MRPPLRAALALLLAASQGVGCDEHSGDGPPPVAPAATSPPSRKMVVEPDGSFSPGCAVLRVGQTVEFLNEAQEGSLPADVTSLKEVVDGREAQSGELYSPNLQAPAPTSWRYRAGRAGVFTFVNASVGIPGRKVVDDYYGTVTFVPLAGGAGGGSFPTGTLCVHDGDDDDCAGVCCPRSDRDCAGRTECVHEQCKPYPDDECRRPGDCAGGLVCGPLGRCIAECRTDRDCPVTHTCADGRCEPAAP